MKCYIVIGDGYSKKEGTEDWAEQDLRYCVLECSIIYGVFKNEDAAVDYILKTWPEVKCVCDDTFGVHFVVEPTEDWMWRNVYQIVEKEIVE